MDSIWTKEIGKINIENKKNNTLIDKADIVIIGGGLVGLLTAYHMCQENTDKRIVILEAEYLASGQTKNTTAKITLQHDLTYNNLINNFGLEKAKIYARGQQWAIEEWKRIVEQENIDCDFTICPSYLYAREDTKQLQQELEAMSKVGIEAIFTKKTELPFSISGAIKVEGQARVQPLSFLQKITEIIENKGVLIYEHTPVEKVEEQLIVTTHGNIQAKHIVFACHYPFINVPGYYFLRMHQERSYAIALKSVDSIEGMYLGIDDGLSFRSAGNYIILGGGSHRTGDNKEGGKYEHLKKEAKQFWPNSEVVTCWSAQDCVTLDDVPYIGFYSADTPGWYVATGFRKWGMTNSMLAAGILSNLILEKNYKKLMDFEKLMTLQRFQLSASAKTMYEEGVNSVKGLTKGLFSIPDATIKDLPLNHGGIIEFEGHKAGVYKDDKGEVYVISAKCPHLGCQLEWNPDEKSFDCPCHGSRYDYKGNLIDNPAQLLKINES